MAPSVILFDYAFSPYAQKVRLLLSAASIPHVRCAQPNVLPRPTLEALGITYRRIPVLAIGKDVYCDSAEVVDVLQSNYGGLPTSPADRAYQAFGDATFWSVLGTIHPDLLTPEFLKDRETIFPTLTRSDFKTLRPSAMGEFKATLDIIEKDFLGQGKFIGGSKLSLADIHVVWVIRWVLKTLGVQKEPGFGKDDFPKVHQWIDSLPAEKEDMISDEEAKKTILGSQSQAKLDMMDKDPLGMAPGTPVSIESTDSAPGSHPQNGKLVGLGVNQIIIELDNGIRLHLPRRGYIVRKQIKRNRVHAPILEDGHSP